jgi:hypothetical protein
LFEELQLLRLNTPGAIQKQIDNLEGIAERSLSEIQEFRSALLQRAETRYVLDDNSADRMLVLLLPKLAKHIVGNHPTGRGVGGPTRISWLAARYLELIASAGKS